MDFKEYREPFFGGGSVGLYLLQNVSRTGVEFFANDINYDLYCFWYFLKTQNKRLVDEIQEIKFKFQNGKELYKILLNRRDKIGDFQKAVDFFILNRITFSGVVDSGGYSQKAFEARFTQSSIERLKNISKIIKRFHFSSEDYSHLITKEGKNVFLFLDPPYYSAKKSKLYGKNGYLHTNFDHKRLCELLKNTCHTFLLTYDDSDFIKELYKDFFIKKLDIQYGMNNFKQTTAAVGKELLISNKNLENVLIAKE